MPQTPAGRPDEDDDLVDLAALALVASGRAPAAERDAALVSAGDILLRRPDLEGEWREMQGTTGQLATLLAPPTGADVLAFPPPAPHRAAPRTRVLGWAAAAAVAAGAAGVGGFVAGHGSSPASQALPQVVVTVAPATATAEGTLLRSAADPGSGATLAVRVVPAAGWVRLDATVTGVAAGRRCRLVAVPRSGDPVLAGSWLVSAKGAREGTGLQGTALIAPADLEAVRVEDDAGTVLVQARI